MKKNALIASIFIFFLFSNCSKDDSNPEPIPTPTPTSPFVVSQLTHLISDAYHPKFSPDGSMIVYTKRTASTVELWIYEVATENNYAIVQGMNGDLTPTWSSDSRKIAFDAFDDSSGRSQIWIKNLDTDAISQFTHYQFNCHVPAWSKDGMIIAFCGNNQIQVKTISSGVLHAIPNTQGCRSPDWKHDDSQIAFTSGPESVNNIYTINIDGSNRTQLTTFAGRDDRPQWSPNGEMIVYEVFENGVGIYLHFLDTGNSFLVKETNSGGGPTWSPSGDRIVFVDTNGIYTLSFQVLN